MTTETAEIVLHPLVAEVLEYQRAEGLTDQAIADRLRIDRTTWLMLRQGQRNPGMKFLRGVYNAFPDEREGVMHFLADPLVADDPE